MDQETGEIVALFHPRKDRWQDHFLFSGAGIIPLTPAGKVTVRLLQLNSLNRLEERELLMEAGYFEKFLLKANKHL